MDGTIGVGEGEIIILQSVEIDIDNNNFFQPLKTWVPSIGISAVKIYYGNEFPHWNGNVYY